MFTTDQTVIAPNGVQFVVTRPGSVVTGVVLHPDEWEVHDIIAAQETFFPTASLTAA